MRRLSAIVVGLSLLCLAAEAPGLHTHVYRDHDHPEHHHALAAHHHALTAHPRSREAHFEVCEPGTHAVAVTISYIHPSAVVTQIAEIVSWTVNQPPLVTASRMAVPLDPRGHSPPARASASLRGPPALIPA